MVGAYNVLEFYDRDCAHYMCKHLICNSVFCQHGGALTLDPPKGFPQKVMTHT